MDEDQIIEKDIKEVVLQAKSKEAAYYQLLAQGFEKIVLNFMSNGRRLFRVWRRGKELTSEG